MAIDSTTPRTRRAILLGSLGGVAAVVATAIGRASPVSGDNGDVVHVGGLYAASRPTRITATGSPAFLASSDTQVAIRGRGTSSGGVWGASGSGQGVSGSSDSGVGVYGYSSVSGVAVSGESLATDQPAVRGASFGKAPGVQGHSGSALASDNAPPPAAKTGIQGSANQDAESVGVSGVSRLGTGLVGRSPEGRGAVLAGGTAQLRLVPSLAKTHPEKGTAGDLFVDIERRLWFCQMGTTWVQIA